MGTKASDKSGVMEKYDVYGKECALMDAMIDAVDYDKSGFKSMMDAEKLATGNGVNFTAISDYNKGVYCTDAIAMIKLRNTKCAKSATTFKTWECLQFDNIRKARMVKAKDVAASGSESWLRLAKDTPASGSGQTAVAAVTKKATALAALNLDQTTLEGALRAIATEETNSASED